MRLLEDRFALKIHTETLAATPEHGAHNDETPRNAVSSAASFKIALVSPAPLTSNWTSIFAAANQRDDTGPSIFTAVNEQVGVKLEATKGPLQLLAVDNANLSG